MSKRNEIQNRKRNYTNHFMLMALLTALAIAAVNFLAMEHRTRIDLTADKRFTLSEGTKRLFERLPEAVTVTYYVDEEPPPRRINLERDVVDKLEELARSSNGKLQYRVDRISNDEVALRREELEREGIIHIVDAVTAGTDEAAQLRGMHGFFSSLKIQYGTAEPVVINGIVNLVDRFDEEREHRVDTLEFDIAYALLRMQHTTERPSMDRLLRSQPEPLILRYMQTEDLPGQFAELGENVHRALEQIRQSAPDYVDYERVLLGEGASDIQPNPAGDRQFRLRRFGEFPRRVGDRVTITPLYTDLVMFRGVDADTLHRMYDFRGQGTVSEIRTAIEENIWEFIRPRTRLGFVLPPTRPQYMRQQEEGQPPVSGHLPLFNYVQGGLGYDTTWVDIKGERRIPRDLACLVVLEPNLLTEREVYEIDRYLAEGGTVALMVQGWAADLDFGATPLRDTISVRKENMQPHFEEWMGHLGLSFGQDLLLSRNAKLTPFTSRRNRFGQPEQTPVPTRAKLAPVIEPGDVNSAHVLTRGLAGLPLPLLVELNADEQRLAALSIEKTELIRLRGDIYRFIPANRSFPALPADLDLLGGRDVEERPDAEPSDTIRAQRLGQAPLVAAAFTGRFPSMWAEQGRNIPGWAGEDPEELTAPPIDPIEGRLFVISTAGALNVEYLPGYQRQELADVIDRGLALFRNIAELSIYGDDLVKLRARTGVAPRISGPITQEVKVFWFLVCLAGVPLLLTLFAGARTWLHLKERRNHEDKAGAAGGDTP